MPSDSDFERARLLFVQGNQAFEAGRLEEAEAHYNASLQALPGRPSTLANLAATRIARGRPQDALELLQVALDAAPQDAQAWSHQGMALAALGRDESAQASHARALQIDPQRPGDWLRRADALNRLGRHTEALMCLDRALAIQPRDAGLHVKRAQTLVAQQRLEPALQALEHALALDSSRPDAWSELGSLLSEMGRTEEALRSWQKALDCGGDEALLRYQMAGAHARLTPEDPSLPHAPAHPPRHYVERLFDGYAKSFDDHLQRLEYRAPQTLANGLAALPLAVTSEGAQRSQYRHALDLGCGTGLCAAPLGPWTLRLTGVDLSAAMLTQARSLGRYDTLVQADLVEHLQHTCERHDLVVAADVFIYVGALDHVFAGVQRVIEPQGVFCCSVECIEDDRDFALLPSLRYGHSQRYLRSLAQAHGFDAIRLEAGPLRRDERHTVRGLYAWFVAQRLLGDAAPSG
jgi:predicted TPR repeat methyltransferase